MTRILRLLLIAAIALPMWQPVAAETITVCGTTPDVSSEFLPVYGYWMDTQGVETQMLYESSLFNGLAGGSANKIDAITFYCKTTVPAALGGKEVIVRMGETYGTTISSRSEMIANRNNMDIVYQGTLPVGSTEMTINLQTAYVYQGNNILIDFYVVGNSTVTGEHCNWIGEVTQENTAWNSKDGGETFLPKMTITYSAFQENKVDFGTVDINPTTPYSDVATFTNETGSEVTITWDASKSGSAFTFAAGSATVAAGASIQIPVTFNPTVATSYTDYITIKVNNKNVVIRLTGIGKAASSAGPVATRDKNFFKDITYTWPIVASNGVAANSRVSNLAEIATDPDQIIAMLRKVYMDQSIPGNFYRSNEKSSNYDSNNTVLYTGVGQINSSGEWVDSYGWDIPGTVQGTSYKYPKIDEYIPEEEGVTLLLLEMVDTFTPPADDATAPTTHDYAQLRTYMANAVKSARVITEAKRADQGQKTGTLFKIDCDKMNNFYLLAKGQLLGYDNSGNNHNYAYPHYYNRWRDYRLQSSYLKQPAFLCHMFEQFSPEVDQSTPKEDLYALMLNMESFAVVHDCPNVPYVNHHFKMYDSDYSGDAADVRDMMFFVPDLRMSYHSNRQEYYAYNPTYAPTMGMYVIDQKEITGAKVNGKDMYQLTLTWDSNLDEFLPGDNQVYYLYQVVIDEDGTEQYNPVYYMNENGEYTNKEGTQVVTTPVPIEYEVAPSSSNKTYNKVYIPMLVSSQVVTFAVQGQDATKFLELKMSNTQDFVIPGLDPNEVVNLIDATHYSRFNPQTIENCYSNRIQMKNAGLTHSQIVTSGDDATKLDIIRSYVKADNTVDETTVATVTFSDDNNGYLNWTVAMNDDSQSPKSKYPNGATSGSAAGYHANTSLTGRTTSRSGNLNLGTNGILFYDNFTTDVSQNDHPSAYSYTMKSNIKGAPAVYLKTKNGGTDYTGDAVWYAWNWSNDNDGEWVRGVKYDDNGTYAFFYNSSKTGILFVRMNPSGAPAWTAKYNQTGNLTASDGATYTITKWHVDDNNQNSDMAVSEPEAGSASVMHSNSYRVPVYKTDSKINNVYTLAQVNGDNDGYHFENDDLTFQEKVQYSSKKDILRYDVYRWADGAEDWGYIIDKVVAINNNANNDNQESDISPNGQADNEDGWYTTKMNADAGENVTVPSGTTNWAVFVDDYPGSVESTQNEQGQPISGLGIAQAFTYAPVVEVFGKGKASHSLTTDRTDYNTYGAPMRNTAVGEFKLKEITNQDFQAGTDHALMSDHKWVKGGKYYSYYNIPLTFTAKNVPAGYKIYKIRVWREIDPSVLGEEFAVFDKNGERDRITPVREIGDAYTYLVADITYPDTEDITSIGSFDDPQEVTVTQENQISGEEYEHTITYTLGTFGAKRVRTSDVKEDDDDYEMYYDDDIDVGFFARIYFTRAANLTSKAAAEGDYYMVEAETDYTIKVDTDIPTAVKNINTREVVGVKYYNTLGIESNRPFDGVNIVVTRYSDGSTTSTKILK
jgi:hypothetical protein